MHRYLLLALCCIGLVIAACSNGGDSSTPVNSGSSAGTITIAATGQTLCYNDAGAVIDCVGSGQDGEWRKGAIWPTLRLSDNGDGTVTDHLTGLMWMQNVDCWGENTLKTRCLDKDGEGVKTQVGWRVDGTGIILDDAGEKVPLYEDCTPPEEQPNPMTAGYEEDLPGDGRVHQDSAESFVEWQNGNIVNCGAGTRYIDWRLPNVRELESILDLSANGANSLPTGHPFFNVPAAYIRTSTPWANGPTLSAWVVNMTTAEVWVGMKSSTDDAEAKFAVWLVRNDTRL